MYFRIAVDVLKNFTMFTGKYLCWSIFLINIQAWRPGTSLKRDFNIGVFQWNLQNFLDQLFLPNASGGCFWKYLMNSLFIALEDDEWWHFVVRTGSPALVSFYCVCFVSFSFSLFFLLFCGFYCIFVLRKVWHNLK